MRFGKYLKDKINYVLVFILYFLIISGYMKAMQIDKNVIIFIIIIGSAFFISGFLVSFILKNKYIKNIENLMDKLDEKYLITEVMDKPKMEENIAYYRILRKANKSMLENIANLRDSKQDYKEYIESWVHEIKIPITSSKLLCENNKSEVTNKIEEEIEEINNFVEQALFYARLEQVSNDFMIKKINLEEIVRNVLSRNKKLMIQNNMKVCVEEVNVDVYTDEKWLEFIINQIIINAIKYKKEKESEITIKGVLQKEDILLFIKDNGIGIKKSEIDRIFDKGFTGTNGRLQKKSTGIGLYLCKKLSKAIGIEIEVDALENEYTKMCLIIPRTKKDIETINK